MFWLSLIFLMCVSCLVVLWYDVPNLQENANAAMGVGASEANLPELVAPPAVRFSLERTVVWLMCLIWPIVIIESVFHWCSRPWNKPTAKYHWFGFLFCICPALRMCAHSPEMGDRLWLHGWGWRRSGKRLRRRLERKFSVPMIVIALLIMPILITEFFLKAQVAQYAWLRFFLHVGTGVVWFAFAFEFILMVSVAEKKLEYCKKHWLDLAIVLLPLVSFLRSIRLIRATRAAKLMRATQMTKMLRMYRLRGTAIKALQALVLLEVFQRLVNRNPEKTIAKLEARVDELEDEAKHLRRKITRLRRKQRELTAGQASASPETPPSAPAADSAEESESSDDTKPPSDNAVLASC